MLQVKRNNRHKVEIVVLSNVYAFEVSYIANLALQTSSNKLTRVVSFFYVTMYYFSEFAQE